MSDELSPHAGLDPVRQAQEDLSTHGAPGFLAAWSQLGSELGVPAAASREIGLDLAARHSEPHRRYHTTRHIEAVLGHLEQLHVTTPVARLAAFFHDAIYDPTRSDNESRSAELARAVLGEAGVGVDVVDDVCDVVVATATHRLPDDGPREAAAFLDADLAILGATERDYDRYAAAIREEYSHVPDGAFAAGRAAVLDGFLERDRLYYSAAGRATWEVQARANLRRELASLT